MQVVVADIHGNLKALKAMLNYISKFSIEEIFCLGDVWGYLPRSHECHELLNIHNTIFIRGNHEEAIINPIILNNFSEVAKNTLKMNIETLTDSEREKVFLELIKMPMYILNNNYLMIHGGWKNWNYLYSKKEILSEYYKINNSFNNIKVVFYAHTHRKAIWYIEKGSIYSIDEDVIYWKDYLNEGGCLFINPGSLGQPRDEDKISTFMLFDDKKIEYVKVLYDIEGVIEEVKLYKYPLICGKSLKKNDNFNNKLNL